MFDSVEKNKAIPTYSGNNVTNEDVIRGELIIDEGDPFTKLNLDKSISKIKARGIFKSVNQEVSQGSDKNLRVISINVEEKPTGEIAAGAGIGTNGGSFGFSVSENNWLGKGTRLNFELEVDEESLGGTLNSLEEIMLLDGKGNLLIPFLFKFLSSLLISSLS